MTYNAHGCRKVNDAQTKFPEMYIHVMRSALLIARVSSHQERRYTDLTARAQRDTHVWAPAGSSPAHEAIPK
jgi:hypothetical protein